MLDLDAEVLAEHTASITAWLPLKDEPRHIVDLGCGTGAGAFALLDRFPDAHVTAVDTSAGHLQLLREKACAHGVQGRVRTVQADLDNNNWPDLGRPDLVWASASMHHLANPDSALRNLREVLTPGGLLAGVELAGVPRFLPAHAPENRPGLEERAHAATNSFHAEHVPHRGADWGPMLTAAGFTVEDERTLTVNIEGARSEAIGRYAYGILQRIRSVAAPALSPEDLAALDELLDTNSPNSLLRREDLAVRTERTVWAARRA
ncbi:methyltransferase domain-containing protein [Streptomyces sp. NPDC005897]|uniref:methyltransferase domain-containing protein n=1 Tax=Streptomyces sp. NPDC005897 TaxID=3157081 RepID=UPI0033FBE7A7